MEYKYNEEINLDHPITSLDIEQLKDKKIAYIHKLETTNGPKYSDIYNYNLYFANNEFFNDDSIEISYKLMNELVEDKTIGTEGTFIRIYDKIFLLKLSEDNKQCILILISDEHAYNDSLIIPEKWLTIKCVNSVRVKEIQNPLIKINYSLLDMLKLDMIELYNRTMSKESVEIIENKLNN